MKIVFADFCRWDFDVRSVETQPLGGAHSAACHLARALARLGQEVYFLSHTAEPGYYHGVTCVNLDSVNDTILQAWRPDVLVCLLTAELGAQLRRALRETTLVLWSQHDHAQPPVSPLREAEAREAFDGYAMVSEWQAQAFQAVFGLERERMAILRNAPAPAFLELFAATDSLLGAKTEPPVLAYTSTPFRGLDVLLECFPAIREAVPGTRLLVFSSLKVYHYDAGEDEAHHGELYEKCRAMPGVEYTGSVAQPELARAMRGVTMLSYSNSFAETSCIAVMEALAAGCEVLTSELAALPETAAGLATLVPVDRGRVEYVREFTWRAIELLRAKAAQPAEWAARRQAQMETMRRTATWEIRAQEWVAWLEELQRRKGRAG